MSGRISTQESLDNSSRPRKTKLPSTRPQVTQWSNRQRHQTEPSRAQHTVISVETIAPKTSMLELETNSVSEISPPRLPNKSRDQKNTRRPVATPNTRTMARHWRSRSRGSLPCSKKNVNASR